MNKLCVGKVVGTHGIKGELKISSSVEISDRVFKVGNSLYFENDEISYKISGIRFHKGNFLVLLNDFNNINDVLCFNKKKVYVDRDSVLEKDEYVLDDLIGFEVVCDDKVYGNIKDYESNSVYATFLVEGKQNFYLPNVSQYVINIDLENKKVYTKNVGDLII